MASQLRIRGLKELQRELRQVSPQLPKALQKAHKANAESVASKVKSDVARNSPARAGTTRAKSGIRPRATQRKASIALLGSNPTVRAVALGTRWHTVFGRKRPVSSLSRPVFGDYIGHEVFNPESGTGDYIVSPVVREELPTIVETYADNLLDAFAKAFPERI